MDSVESVSIIKHKGLLATETKFLKDALLSVKGR